MEIGNNLVQTLSNAVTHRINALTTLAERPRSGYTLNTLGGETANLQSELEELRTLEALCLVELTALRDPPPPPPLEETDDAAS